ncbi:MAG TPA: hypothetical protein VGF00_09920 [Acidimicrobiia bacterium]
MRMPRRRLVTLVASAAVALALAAPPASATGHAPPPRQCRTGDVVERVHTDHARYAPGKPVTVTLAATNRSGHDCTMPSVVFIEIRSASGASVWQAGIAVDWIRTARWKAGKAVSWSATWDQQVCNAKGCTGRAAPGTYTVSGAWNSYRPGTASFIVNGIK